MADFTWEQAIKVLLPDTNSLTNRDAVMSEKWLDQETVHVVTVAGNGESHAKNFDISHVIPLDTNSNASGQLSCVIGFNVPWKRLLDNGQSKFNMFHHDANKALSALVFSPRDSGVANFTSFQSAAALIRDVNAWLRKWGPLIKGWEGNVDADDSEWKGSAAGAFKKFLDVISTEMSKVQFDLAQPQIQPGTKPPETIDLSAASGYETLISDAENRLRTSVWNMYTELANWWWPPGSPHMNPGASPVSQMYEVFKGVMSAATCTFTWKQSGKDKPGTVSFSVENLRVFDNSGSEVTQQFWLDGIESVAKQNWAKNLSVLDQAAKANMGPLDDAYLKLGNALRDGIYQPRIQMPTGGTGPNSAGPPGGAGGGTGGGTGGGIGGGKGGGTGGGIGGGKGGGSGIGDPFGKNKGGNGSGGTGGPKTKIPESLPGRGNGGRTGPPPPGSLPGTGSTGGGTAPLLNKNGKPVLGPDGKPVMVPPGSRIGKDGKVYDANGKPVMGSGGKQVVAPPGGKVGQPAPRDENQNGGLAGSNPYDQLRLPEGAKVLANGTVVDAKGKPLLDSNGNPYALPEGATLKDGIVVDANGKPISRSHQLLTNAEHAINSRPDAKIMTSGGGTTGKLPDLTHFGSGGGGLGDPPKPKSFSATSTGGATLLGERAAGSIGLPAGSLGSTATAGNGGSQQQSTGGPAGSMTGTTPPMTPPMMPPMSPGAGAGAGQPNQGNDRQRTTWLTEDEETWGTDSGSVSGVIGR